MIANTHPHGLPAPGQPGGCGEKPEAEDQELSPPLARTSATARGVAAGAAQPRRDSTSAATTASVALRCRCNSISAPLMS
jgi:hypothetical protein